jgi:hypothetical protein
MGLGAFWYAPGFLLADRQYGTCGLLTKVTDNEFTLPENHRQNQTERIMALRKIYAHPWNHDDELRQFGDLQSLRFRLDYYITWSAGLPHSGG